MTEQQKLQLIAAETAAFLNDGFGQLDLSGSPDLVPLPNEEFASHDRKGFNNVVISGTNLLKELANNPPEDIIERIAQETGDPELQARITEGRETTVAEHFVRSHSSYFKSDNNYESLRQFLDDRNQEFNEANLDVAFKSLSRSGQLETRPGQARNLSESDQLHIISLCKAGQLDDAIEQYLDYSLPDASKFWNDATAFLSDPETLPVRNKASYFVWWHSRSGVDDTPEFHAFGKAYFRLRPVHTVQDFDDCWAAFEKKNKSFHRDQLFHEAPVTPDDLNDLSDDAVTKLTHSVLQKRAKDIRLARRRSV